MWGCVPGVGQQVIGDGHGGRSGCDAITRVFRMHVPDSMSANKCDRVSQGKAHLRLEHLIDGPATQLARRKACRRHRAGHRIRPAVLVLDGDSSEGRDVDREPSEKGPEVRTTDAVAVFLKDRLE